MTENLIFLGSGASVPFGLPTMQGLVNSFEIQLEQEATNNSVSEILTLYRDIKQNLEKVYDNVDLESIFSVLGAIERDTKYSDLPFVFNYIFSKFKELKNSGIFTSHEIDITAKLSTLYKNFVREKCTINHDLYDDEIEKIYGSFLKTISHYHVGVFAFTGSGKSNLTSLVLRKSVNSLPNMKFVIFDISSEYGINILDLLKSIPSRVIFTDELRGKDIAEKAKDYLRRHVIPETLEVANDTLLISIEETIRQNKVKKIFIQSESEQGLQGITSYGGLLGTLGDLAGEKYGAAAQKILIPTIAGKIRKFMVDNNIEDESTAIGKEVMPLIESVEKLLAAAKLRQDAALISIFNNLKLVLDNPTQRDFGDYNSIRLVREIMDDSKDSK
jgi:hypothetical protein